MTGPSECEKARALRMAGWLSGVTTPIDGTCLRIWLDPQDRSRAYTTAAAYDIHDARMRQGTLDAKTVRNT